MSKLEQIISTAKDIISSLELKYRNLLEEIKSLRERERPYGLVQNSSSSHKDLDEFVKCDQCKILKNKIDGL